MRIKCNVCMHGCELEEGQHGICKARYHDGSSIIAGNYGKITSIALDPIEKKPLHHFHPGTKILSVGSYGCNLRCSFCQNHSISMMGEGQSEYFYLSPADLAAKAQQLVKEGNIGVAYTYNEPLIGYEYVRDTAILVRKLELKNVVVTNGSFTKETAQEILPYIDALNIDLKGFTEEFYKKLGGDLETVKTFIELAAQQCHVELTTLIIPGENDSIDEMKALSQWVASINRRIPLHISRFFPAWKMIDKNPTAVEKIYELADIARLTLEFVHEGNCEPRY